MENLIELNLKELNLINGGTFAWDAGWFLGNTLAGNFTATNPAGTIDALMDYYIHYNN